MRFPQQYVLQSQVPSGSQPLTGAAPVVAAGLPLDGGLVGTELAAVIAISLTTTSLTAAAKWQVNVAGSWFDVPSPTNTTVLATGTGSLVTTTVVLPAPPGLLAGSRQVRAVVVSGAGTGASGDHVAFSYDFRQPTNTLGS